MVSFIIVILNYLYALLTLYFHKDLYLDSFYFIKEILYFLFKGILYCVGNVTNVDTNLSLKIFQKRVLNALDVEIMTAPLV